MDPSKIPAGIDPERAFSLDVRVSAYTAKLDDDSETNIHRQDLEWVVDTVGYRFESFIQDLGERIIWGSSQEPAIWCFDRNCGEQFRMLTTFELHNAFNERWNLKWLCVFVEIVDKSGYQCSQSNATQLNIVDLDEANPSNAAHISNAADRVVDWSSIEIQVGPNVGEDDRDVAVTEEQMYAILGLRDDDARAEERRRAPPISAPNATNAADDDNVEAAIPVDDSFAGVTNIGYDRQDPHMKFGITYPSMAEFKMATKQYAIKHEFDMGTEKSDTTRFRGFCRGEGCEWRIVGILMPDNKTVRVSKMIDKHTCASTSRVKTSMASQAWIAERSLGILRKTPNMGAKELQERLQDQYNITLTYPTVWKGRQRAIEQLYCPWEESFHMLYNFKAEVEFRSPGSFVEIGTKTVNGDIYFHRFFLAFKPCIDGFVNGCRPYLSIDSTALNGKWNGHLAAVTALDGHNWMFPVAFGFLESEFADNWTWFMQQLKKAIGHQSILAVSTDACKGLENAVNKVFPGTEQRECFRHLMLNFVKKFHGDVFGNMWPAASAYTPERFEYHMNKILTSCPNVADYLNRHHNLLWMRSKFSTEIKCEYINNNLAESFNSWIKDIKDLPVVDLADKLHEMIMELFDKRRRIGERLDGYILPAIVHQLNARTRGLANLTVKRSANHNAQVIETDENHKTVRHVVQLLNHECTCREWQLTGKPCSHALAFITTERNASMESFVHEYYTLSKFRAAYEGVIELMTDKSQWPQVDPGFKMLPPLKKRSSGRPRKLRFKNCFEKGGDAAKKQHKCKQCGELGHRQAGCPLNGPKKRMTKSQKKAKSKEIHTPKKMRTSFDATTTDSPGPMTRRQLALSIGEGASQSAVTTSRMTTRSPANATANKKLTPKRKRN